MLDVELLLNVFDAIIIIGVAIPSAYVASRIQQRKLRILTMLLASFLVLHGLYHLAAVLSGGFADLFVEPLGWVFFLSFAVYFWRNT